MGEPLTEPAPAPIAGLYLLHLQPRYLHAGHYLGVADDIRRRVLEHAAGGSKSSPLVRAQLGAGGSIQLARIWPGESRGQERRLKRQGGLSRHCPICRRTGAWHR